MALTVAAPEGAHFEFDEVKTAHGQKSLGPVPILKWDTVPGLVAHYGEEGVLSMSDGTSPRVAYQGIARRMKMANKSDDEIAKAQLDYKPGTRVVGAPTPVSRAAKAAKVAAEKLGGDAGDTIAAFLERVAAGDINPADLAALAK